MFKRNENGIFRPNLPPKICKAASSSSHRRHKYSCSSTSLPKLMKELDKSYYSLEQLNDHQTAIKIATSTLLFWGKSDLVLGAIVQVLIDWLEYDFNVGIVNGEKWLRVIIQDWGVNSPQLNVIRRELKELKRLELYSLGKRTQGEHSLRKKRKLVGGSFLILNPKNAKNCPQKSPRSYTPPTTTANYNITLYRKPSAASRRFKTTFTTLRLSRRECSLISVILAKRSTTLAAPGPNHPADDWEAYLELFSTNLQRFYTNFETFNLSSLRQMLTMQYSSPNGDDDEQVCGLDIFSRRYNPSPTETLDTLTPPSPSDHNHKSSNFAGLFSDLKARIFKVCKLVNVNVNAPFIATELFSLAFQNITCGTHQQLSNLFGFIFNASDGDFDLNFVAGRTSEVFLNKAEIAMLYLIAVNCLQLALYIQNGNIRFDVSNLFYLFVFVDVIAINGDCCSDGQLYQRLKASVPILLTNVDVNMTMQQKMNYGTSFVSRTCRYHHDLLKHRYGHLIKELRRNRLLQVIGIESLSIPSCLDYFQLFTHGMYAHSFHQRVYEAAKRWKSFGGVGLSSKSCSRRLKSFATKNGHMEAAFAADITVEDEVVVTEIAIVLLHIMSRSIYMEVLNGNTLFTDANYASSVSSKALGGEPISSATSKVIKLNASMLKALVVIYFMIDIFSNIEDHFLVGNSSKSVHHFNLHSFLKGNDVAITPAYSSAEIAPNGTLDLFTPPTAHLDEFSISRLNAGYKVFYLEILQIDWIMHHGGLYKGQDYQNYYKIMGLHARNSECLVQSLEEQELKKAYTNEWQLYHEIAVIYCEDVILAGDGILERFKACGKECQNEGIETLKTPNFNHLDRPFNDWCLDYSREDPGYQEATQKFFQSIYYPEVTAADYNQKWNPWNVLYSCRHSQTLFEIIIRCKLRLLNFYYGNIWWNPKRHLLQCSDRAAAPSRFTSQGLRP